MPPVPVQRKQGDLQMTSIRSILVVALLALGAPLAAFADGTLAINIAPFTSEVKLKDKVRKQLEGGGMEWGLAGNRMVITSVNKQYVGPTINQLTRFGTNTTMNLPAGDYHVCVVGMIYDGGMSVSKVLSKGGYFNENVMTFRIEEGKTTTLDVRPIIRPASGALLKIFMPEYMATTTLDAAVSAEVSLNGRTEKSVAWDDYNCDLKFKK
jgi:hypothetical protein